MTRNRPPTRHVVHVHYHGLTPADPRYTQVLDLLATISARVQALPPDAAIADITGAERYFELLFGSVGDGMMAAVSRASLQTDLANARERNKRLAARVRQLEKRLSQSIGAKTWADSGLGASADVDQLQRRITMLEQQLSTMQGELDERIEELEAARAANREMTRSLNHRPARL
ncbi:tropomyosin [Streptomyces sp. HUAS TT20]|uniref:tropomyosin n=1 Tax=Streptomyces sp. HUAS TT20 TaxID=3447509 RepID=UPI0021D81240|nr:tropomyosin [Streptomyces sp. HUAS 15-9]UXY32392.1 tropomyosin [Streptomyces sp. HUAS 15-9]